MAQVSTDYFYFEEFGFSGYSGLRHALSQDLIEIQDIADYDLIQPGIIHDLQIEHSILLPDTSTIVHFWNNERTISIIQRFSASHLVTQKLRTLSSDHKISAKLIRSKTSFRVGTLFGTFYLIDSTGQIQNQFPSATSLLQHVKEHSINIRGVEISDIFIN